MKLSGNLDGCDIVMHDCKHYVRQSNGWWVQINLGAVQSGAQQKLLASEYEKMKRDSFDA